MTRFTATFALSLLLAAPAGAQIEPGCYRNPSLQVIDGDKVSFQGENVHLLGYDAPETRQYECHLEVMIGDEATARLRNLLESHEAILCIPSSDCGHGRPCGWLAILDGGETLDVGSILMGEGLAMPFVGGPAQWCR